MFSRLLEEKNTDYRTKALHTNSCAAHACAILFTILISTKEKTLGNLASSQDIFEICIYPEIWREYGAEADEEKALRFFNQVIDKNEMTRLTYDEAETLGPEPNAILFRIIRRKDTGCKHVDIIFSTKNVFIFVTDQGFRGIKSLTVDDTDEIEYLLKIPCSSVKVDAVQALYENYRRNMVEIFSKHYLNEKSKIRNPTSIVTLGRAAPALLSCARIKLTRLIAKNLNCLEDGFYIDAVMRLFPELKSEIAENYFLHKEKYIRSWQDVVSTQQMFPQLEARILAYVIIHPELFPRESFQISRAIEHFPNSKAQIKTIAQKSGIVEMGLFSTEKMSYTDSVKPVQNCISVEKPSSPSESPSASR
ncbi:MAG: hypothetical protein ABI597_04845 [Gammaproteobacteria bacterium]